MFPFVCFWLFVLSSRKFKYSRAWYNPFLSNSLKLHSNRTNLCSSYMLYMVSDHWFDSMVSESSASRYIGLLSRTFWRHFYSHKCVHHGKLLSICQIEVFTNSISSAERFNLWPGPDVISNECFCLRWNFHRGLVLRSWLKIESIHLHTSRDLIIKEFLRQVTNNWKMLKGPSIEPWGTEALIVEGTED